MASFGKKLLNFILYSNLWIAVAAVCMCAKTIHLLDFPVIEWNVLYLFVFCATLFIYAGHRVVGIRKSEAFIDAGRYKVIARYKHHIILYATLGFLGTCITAFYLSWWSWLALGIPALVSLAYIFPIFPSDGGRRLRDIDDVKIFLVAIVWMVVAVLLPYIEMKANQESFLIFAIMECLFFVFAITIPFDIRDLDVDGHNSVQTIPARVGERNARILALMTLLLAYVFGIVALSYTKLEADTSIYVSFSLGYMVTGMLIFFAHTARSDYYYTGFLDGTMILMPLLVILR